MNHSGKPRRSKLLNFMVGQITIWVRGTNRLFAHSPFVLGYPARIDEVEVRIFGRRLDLVSV